MAYFHKSLYDEIGGYSTYFWFNCEQEDFALRAKKEGYKLIYTPKAKIWHKGSASIGGRNYNPKLVYWHIQSILMVTYLHLNKRHFFAFFIIILGSISVSVIKAPINWIKGRDNLVKYSLAKLFALAYFLKWLIIKNNNTGYYPFN